MKTIIFRDELDPETVQKLIDDIEQPHEENKEHDIRILLSCHGGDADMSMAVINCINTLSKEFKVELVITYRANSAAFIIFVKTNCKKSLYDGAHSVVHLLDKIISMNDVLNSKKSYDKFLVNNVQLRNTKYLKWLKSLKIFTQKELKKISRGKDVYVERERLQKIIDNQNKK